ncbi:MAG TPA: zinc ribbon domain-containing protein [Planctomycetaceae bacterium]|nr:zinc ribbon domain-containing protein [Planctomycetaceae bacterium]
MPTYDYQCKQCDHRWELFQSIKAKPVRRCPECGKLKAQRVIGAGAGILFRGSGFYQTDYRSDAYKKAADADKKSQSGGDGKSEGNGKAAKSDSGSKSAKADGGSKSAKADA